MYASVQVVLGLRMQVSLRLRGGGKDAFDLPACGCPVYGQRALLGALKRRAREASVAAPQEDPTRQGGVFAFWGLRFSFAELGGSHGIDS